MGSTDCSGRICIQFNTINKSTSKRPFEVIYGIHPRGVLELREMGETTMKSGYAQDFSQSLLEVHDMVKKTFENHNAKLKTKVDDRKIDIQFQVGDLFMVNLNKHRMTKGQSTKLQMKRIGPCTILDKYGRNAYKVDLLFDLGLCPVFNVVNLVAYKGPPLSSIPTSTEVATEMEALKLPKRPPLEAEKILSSRIVKETRTKVYWEHLIK